MASSTIPEEPRRPLSGYFLFVNGYRPILRAELGDTVKKTGAITKMLAQKWMDLSAAERSVWEAKADEGREDHKKLVSDFLAAGGVPGVRRQQNMEIKRQKIAMQNAVRFGQVAMQHAGQFGQLMGSHPHMAQQQMPLKAIPKKRMMEELAAQQTQGQQGQMQGQPMQGQQLQNFGLHLQKKARKVRDPDEPKKPTGGAFGTFREQHREEIMKQLGDKARITLVPKVASAMWKEVSTEERAKYEVLYQARREQYLRDLEDWSRNKRQEATNDSSDVPASSRQV